MIKYIIFLAVLLSFLFLAESGATHYKDDLARETEEKTRAIIEMMFEEYLEKPFIPSE